MLVTSLHLEVHFLMVKFTSSEKLKTVKQYLEGNQFETNGKDALKF